MYSHRNSTS